MNIKIYKMGNKLGIYFQLDLYKSINIRKGDLVEVILIKNGQKDVFMTKFNQIISLKKNAVLKLNIKAGDKIIGNVIKIFSLKKTNNPFYGDMLDLLYFIPKKTKKNFKIFINEFIKNNEEWLRIWSCHGRGSCYQIEIKRFVKSNLFGRFLGQIQAEGSKKNFKRVEFCNKSIQEHIDFIRYLEYLGITKDKIFSDCDYSKKVKNIKRYIKDFEDATKIKISYKKCSNKSVGGFGFHTFVRSTLLSETILSTLDIIRNHFITRKWNLPLQNFFDGFLAKILNGDGNIEIITKNRKTPQARLKISDGNFNYLNNYKTIMEKYGFVPHINKKYGFVRSYLNNKLAKKLSNIGAFDGNQNKNKLIFFIKYS